MGKSAALRITILGLLMLMAGFATAGFFSGRRAALVAFVLFFGGIEVVLWGKRQ